MQVSHPPHLTSDWSSALIPFCAFKTKLKIGKKGIKLPGMILPLCSAFLPTMLDGQLCYKLSLNMTSKQGKENELLLLLDYNEDRSIQLMPVQKEIFEISNEELNLGTSFESFQTTEAKVQIGTLSPYIGFGGGMYKMTGVKRMSAKGDFLKMDLKNRNCKIELEENCRTRKLLEQCECVPWEVTEYQVGYLKQNNFLGRESVAVLLVETALKRISGPTSTATLLVKGFMLTSNGWRSQWVKKVRKSKT